MDLAWREKPAPVQRTTSPRDIWFDRRCKRFESISLCFEGFVYKPMLLFIMIPFDTKARSGKTASATGASEHSTTISTMSLGQDHPNNRKGT